MSEILFKMAAKTNVGLERQNNEDNFQVSANLDIVPMQWVNNQQYSLGNRGALMVVADGMGGMNAGEVASQIAIDTVRSYFTPENITDEVVKSRFTIEKFMKDVIVAADQSIKDYAKAYPESRNMGTTIVVGWLFDDHLYVSWVGDSRAYIYNKNTGLFQVSKDHSYVQELVDSGKISEEDAFDYPDSNIITRSLSDSTQKAVPECLLTPQKLCNGDIILLCSDGLCGMIRDRETEQIIADNQTDMTQCVDSLIQAALDAGGADNCTVALCQIVAGGAESELSRVPKKKVAVAVDRTGQNGGNVGVRPAKGDGGGQSKLKKLLLPLIALVMVVGIGILAILKPWEKPASQDSDNQATAEHEKVAPRDTLFIEVFQAKVEKDKKVHFTITVKNCGDSLQAADYSIGVQYRFDDMLIDGLQLVDLPKDTTVTFLALGDAPEAAGEHTYQATVRTRNSSSSQKTTITTGNKVDAKLASAASKIQKQQNTAGITEIKPKDSATPEPPRLITRNAYLKNKNKYAKELGFYTWEKKETFDKFIDRIVKMTNNEKALLKELNKNQWSDAELPPNGKQAVNLFYVKPKQ